MLMVSFLFPGTSALRTQVPARADCLVLLYDPTCTNIEQQTLDCLISTCNLTIKVHTAT